MRFAFYSIEGTSLAYWKRVQDEGNEVLVYVERPSHTGVGQGIVPRTNNFAQWQAWGKGGVFVFDCTDAGDKADALRKSGELVLGGGKFCDRLEKDRAWGSQIAGKVGLQMPKTREFASITAALIWLQAQDEDAEFFFKPDKDIGTAATCSGTPEKLARRLAGIVRTNGESLSNIVQVKIPGVAVSTARWWNGKNWTGPIERTIEHKAFMNDGVGPATGCSFNVLWYENPDECELAKDLKFDRMAGMLEAFNASPGIYDINAQLSDQDGEPYFLEWTPRFGCDSEPTGQHGITDLGKVLYTLASGGDVESLFTVGPFYGSVRLSVSPYPLNDFEALPAKKSSQGLEVWGVDGLWAEHFVGYSLAWDEKLGLHLGDGSGLVGLSTGVGHKIAEPFEAALKFVKQLDVAGLQYRTDAAECIEKDFKKMVSLGY